MASNGISGPAVAAIGVGGLLVYFGIQNIPIQDGLRSLLKGQFPSAGAQTKNPKAQAGFGISAAESTGGLAGGIAGATGGSNGPYANTPTGKAGEFLSVIRAQIGKPYVWAAVGPNSFDCSGLVVYGLRRVGMNVTRHTTWTFLVWNGATSVKDPAPGDLVCWTAHMGVYIGNGRMIHAPAPGKVVEEAPVTPGLGGPVYRRVKW